MRSLLGWFRREETHRVRLLDADALFLCVVACFWYFTAYLLNPATPAPSAVGWWGFFDQGLYYRTTMDLAAGHLLPSNYWYGYPLLGAIFYQLMPLHPYFIPNLTLILLMVSSYFAACRLFCSRLEAWGLVIVAIFADSMLRDGCLIIPWNTLPEYAAFYLCFYFLIFTRATLPRFALCAFFCGLACASRFTESEILAVVYLFALIDLRGWGTRLFAVALFAFAFGIALALNLGTNLYFYHALRSPYMVGQWGDFSTSHYLLKIYQLLFDGDFLTGPNAALHPPTRQILESYWPFIFMLPGAVFLVRTYGWKVLGFFLGILLSVAFYLLYNPTNNAPYFWSYGSFHYFWWLMPWLAFITYLSFRRAPFALGRRLYLATLLGPLLVVLPLGVRDVVLASSTGPSPTLTFQTASVGDTAALQITSHHNIKALDLRVYFTQLPSFPGSDASSVPLIHISINGSPALRDQWDYMTSQSASRFDFCFLPHDLHLQPGDRVTIQFSKTKNILVDHLEAVGVAYAPFGAVRHFVQNDL